jgi:tetratricopeptide (TPR) repeat protein
MVFNGTADTLFPWMWAEDMQIERETELAQLLICYQHQLESDQHEPDPGLLEQALHLLQHRLSLRPVDQELAHLGDAVYCYLGYWEQTRDLLAHYRAQALPLYEEAWARWRTIDCLALEHKCEAVVAEQPVFLQWAMQSLPLENCLFVLNDATQAVCWNVAGKQQEWFRLFKQLMAAVPPTHQNREDRFLCIRTAIAVHLHAGHPEQARKLLPLFDGLELQGFTWEENTDMQIEIQAMHIKILGMLQDTESLRQIGKQVTDQLTNWKNSLQNPKLALKRQIRRLCHNIASSLYKTRQYDLAVPLFQMALELGGTSEHTYAWLAASLWMRDHELVPVANLLQQAEHYDPSGKIIQTIRSLPELQDFPYEPQFQPLHT